MTSDGPDRTEPTDWWLSQGDIFADMPVIDTALGSGIAIASIPRGAAMLVTHDCMLDKTNKEGVSLVHSLTFLRLLSVDAQLGPMKQGLIGTRDKEQPFRTLYVGHVDGFGEAYVDLNTPFSHPVERFGIEQRPFGDNGDLRLFPTINGKRSCRLSDELLKLFRIKWSANWTALKPE